MAAASVAAGPTPHRTMVRARVWAQAAPQRPVRSDPVAVRTGVVVVVVPAVEPRVVRKPATLGVVAVRAAVGKGGAPPMEGGQGQVGMQGPAAVVAVVLAVAAAAGAVVTAVPVAVVVATVAHAEVAAAAAAAVAAVAHAQAAAAAAAAVVPPRRPLSHVLPRHPPSRSSR